VKTSTKRKSVKFDSKGVQLLVFGLMLILLASVVSSLYDAPFVYFVLGVGGILVLCFFIHHELRRAPNPLLNLRLARDRTVAAGCLGTFLYYYGFCVYEPYYYTYLVVTQDMPVPVATNAGLSSVFSATVFGLAASFAVRYSGRYHWLVIISAIVRFLGGVALLISIDPKTPMVQTFASQILSGAGTGMVALAVNLGVQAAVIPRRKLKFPLKQRCLFLSLVQHFSASQY
jgi:hypothetical protein